VVPISTRESPKVQTRSCRMSHANNLHLGGAQAFQIEVRTRVGVQFANWSLYAEAVVYSPCFVGVQVILSSCWRRNVVGATRFYSVVN
jgi:hypothetical protein